MSPPSAPEDPRPDSADLRGALREALIVVACAGTVVTYAELAARVGISPPHRIHRLTLALEDLVRTDHAAGRPLLAALAVSRAGEGLPGRGYFMLLSALGRYRGPPAGPQAKAAHAAELARVYAHWGPIGDGRGSGDSDEQDP
jgi:hypothetical protein